MELTLMPKPWTSKLIIKALGVKKCNGSLDAATESLSLEKAMGVAKEKADLGHLTGADLKAQTREIIGTCVSMRVKIDGHWANEALQIISNGEWDERFN
jgi:large subunit ribosomal protein L11|tara:strand:- start:223 stop:519 length:297 start_codon:yes stop_codon:yes gene_type:complete